MLHDEDYTKLFSLCCAYIFEPLTYHIQEAFFIDLLAILVVFYAFFRVPDREVCDGFSEEESTFESQKWSVLELAFYFS